VRTGFRKLFFINHIDYVDVFYLLLKRRVAQSNSETVKPEKKKDGLAFVNYILRGVKNKIDFYLLKMESQILLKKNEQLSTTDFLLLTVEPTQTKQLKELYKEILVNGKSAVFITDRIKLCKQLRKEGIKVHLIVRDYSAHAQEANNIITLATSMANDDEEYNTLAIMREYLSLYLSMAADFENIIKKTKPKHVFIGYDITQEGRLMDAICKNSHIPTYCIQHGFTFKESIHSEHVANRFFVFGEVTEKNLLSSGMSKSKVFISGAPYMDSYEAKGEMNSFLRKKIPAKYGNFILICTSGAGHSTSLKHHLEMIRLFEETISNFQEIFFVIKLHRKDSTSYYNVLNTYKNVLVISPNDNSLPENIFEYFTGCNALITGASSSATEAMSLGIPVITIDLLNEFENIDFINVGATIHTCNKKEFTEALGIIRDMNNARVRSTLEAADSFSKTYFNKSNTTACSFILNHLIENQETCAA
jgi:UDP-N-acetylglucosamine 2-epimerase